jgi:MFS transporter, DHA2 family, multidrug resistance protein
MSVSIPANSAGAGPGSVAQAAELADRPLLETKHRGLLLVGVMLVSICQFLDATIANVALPHMAAALGASPETISWVLTSFIIAIATPVTGWLSDQIGSRNLFIGATALFLISSAACGAATSLEEMVVFRAVQGIAAGFIAPLTMTIMFDVSAPSKQAMTMSYFSMIVMVAPISGPTIGGFLTDYVNWRWIFFVNLPLGLPALFLVWWLLPSRPLVPRRLDIFGFSALALGLGMLQLMLDRGQSQDWFSSWEINLELIIALSALWIFIIHSRNTKSPLFRRELYKNVNFTISLGFMAIMGASVVGLSAVLPMMYQSIYNYPVTDTGLLMAPRGFGVMIASYLAGRIIRYVDARYVISFGYIVAASGMWLMTSWALEMDYYPIVIAGFIQGVGFGLIVAPMNLLAFATLLPSLRPDGSSLMALFRSLGGSIGISIIVTLLSRGQQRSHAELGAHVTASSFPAVDLPATVDRMQGLGGGIMMAIDAEVARQATMITFLDIFHIIAWVLLLFAPLPLLLRKPKEASDDPPMHIE